MASTTRLVSRTGWWVMAVPCVAIALISYRYLIGLGMSPDILANGFARPWLTIHVVGAATALLVGAFQFLPGSPGRGGRHRWRGRVYVVGCLAGGGAGLMLALGSTAGPVAGLGFGGLAVAWIAVNLLGWRAARAGDFAAHRRWMIRSWALTLAAVTLRLYLPLLGPLGIPFLDGYRAISFLAWIPNLVIAELHLSIPVRRPEGRLPAGRSGRARAA